jgi:hypothetical protein
VGLGREADNSTDVSDNLHPRNRADADDLIETLGLFLRQGVTFVRFP